MACSGGRVSPCSRWSGGARAAGRGPCGRLDIAWLAQGDPAKRGRPPPTLPLPAPPGGEPVRPPGLRGPVQTPSVGRSRLARVDVPTGGSSQKNDSPGQQAVARAGDCGGFAQSVSAERRRGTLFGPWGPTAKGTRTRAVRRASPGIERSERGPHLQHRPWIRSVGESHFPSGLFPHLFPAFHRLPCRLP